MGNHPDEAKERRERILKSFKESASIHQLAGNAMLLTIMTIIGKHQELPRERWKLYDHAASVLIQHWDVNKHLKDKRIEADFIGEDDKKELLRRLAFRMQGGESGLTGNYIHREQLQAEFESYLRERYSQTPDRAVTIARAMIDQFRERNFILCLYGANLHGFVHRAFLEYFSATAFVYQFEKTQEMTLQQLRQEVYGIHWQDRNWHEVLRLICGIIDEKWAGEIIDYLINEIYRPWPNSFSKTSPWNIALAVQCLGEVRNINMISEYAENLLLNLCLLIDRFIATGDSALYGFIQGQIMPTLQFIGIAWPGREVVVAWLKKSLPFHIQQYTAEFIGNFVGSVGGGLEELHEILLEHAHHSTGSNRVVAYFALLKGWATNAQTMQLFLQEPSSNIRASAIHRLAEYSRGDARTLTILHERAVNDPDPAVRQTAISALVQYCRDDAQTLPFLRDRAIEDNSRDVRQIAILALVQYYRDDAQTLPFLRDRAIEDNSRDVGQAVALALVQYYRDDVQTLPFLRLPFLREWVLKSASSELRQFALIGSFRKDFRIMPFLHEHTVYEPDSDVDSSAIVEYYRDDAQTLPFLHERTVDEPDSDVDSSPIAEYFRSDAQTLPFLRERAVNDPDPIVRQTAISTLVQYYRDDVQTLPFLRERAVNEANSNVRSYAFNVLITYSRDDPQILPFLRERAINDASPKANAVKKPWNNYVREIAISLIARYWPTDPATLTLLRDRAENDPTPWLRRRARKLITKIENEYHSGGGH